MSDFETFLKSPTFVMSFLSGLVWLIRGEFKNNKNASDIKDLKSELKDHKDSSSERNEKIYGKFDEIQKDIGKISTSLARIEGKLDHRKE